MIKLLIYLVILIQASLLCSQTSLITKTIHSNKQIKLQPDGDIIYPNYIPTKF
jgi:hypothetical protein